MFFVEEEEFHYKRKHLKPFSVQVITFIDLAGHEKYLKTTIFGMTGHAPDFAMLMVGTQMTQFL